MLGDETIKNHLKWLHRGNHRRNVLNQIGQFNQAGKFPDQVTLLTSLKLSKGSSAFGNGRLAIMGLIERGFITNKSDKARTYALAVHWEQVSVYSDWLEEQGKKRLEVEKWQG